MDKKTNQHFYNNAVTYLTKYGQYYTTHGVKLNGSWQAMPHIVLTIKDGILMARIYNEDQSGYTDKVWNELDDFTKGFCNQHMVSSWISRGNTYLNNGKRERYCMPVVR